MASPRYVPPPKVESIADQYLAIHAEGFRQRWAAAQADADAKIAADSAEYQARVEWAKQRLKGAQAERKAASDAALKVEIEDAKGAVSALRAANQASFNAALAAIAQGRGRAETPLHQQMDEGEDAVQKYLAGLDDWREVYKAQPPEVRDMLDTQLQAVAGLDAPQGVKKLVALAGLEQGGDLGSTSLATLVNAGVREAMLGNDNWQGTLKEVLDNLEAMGLRKTAATVYNGVRQAVDIPVKGANNPREKAEIDAKKKADAANAAANKAEAKAAAPVARPDFTAARELVGERSKAADAALADASDDFPEKPLFVSRLAATRDAYDQGFGGPKKPRAQAIPDDVWNEVIAEATRPASRPAAQPAQRPTSPKFGAKADTPEAKAKEAEADAVVREPIPSTMPAKQAPAALRFLESLGPLDLDESHGEMEIKADPLAQHKALLERHGLIARDGTARRARAERLVSTTAEGQRAKAALDDAGGDLDEALARLKDERTRAIAAALVA